VKGEKEGIYSRTDLVTPKHIDILQHAHSQLDLIHSFYFSLSYSTMLSLKSLSASLVGVLSLSAGASAAGNSDLVASTYFAGFHANRGFPVSAMPWDKYTDAKYSFAETTEDGGLDLSQSQPEELSCFVNAAKKNGVKALVSIGGWTGARYFSTNFGNEKNRTAFVKTCVDFVKEHDLDGLDFDWEYPNRQGLGCNTINDNDTANFLEFLKQLRQDPVGKGLYLTAASSLFPWNDKAGSPSKDLGGFADVLDYIMIMVISHSWVGMSTANEFCTELRSLRSLVKRGRPQCCSLSIL
jgi:chitinase